VNPYTITNFRTAFSAIFPNSSYVLPVTHRYIKFTPTTPEQVKALFNSEYNMYDYPLDREVIEMGDYYLPPGASATDMPILYAVIPLDKTIPNISHEILSELHLNSPNELIIRQALTQAGYDPDVEGYTIYDGASETTTQTTDHCQCTEYIQGNPVNTFIIDSQGEECNYFDEFHGPGYSIECNSFTYPPIDDGLTTNTCGCQVFSDQSKPGGCLRVNDTEFGWRGVRRVKVILKDNWFTEDEVWSDDAGCFRVNKKYKGVAWMWVKFSSPRITIRGARFEFGVIWEWMVPVKDYVGRVYNTFNNISVDYDTWTNLGSSAQLYWGAANINNALHEFYEYAATDGINPPPSNLDVYAGWNSDYGYALMESQQILAGAGGAFVAGLTFWTGPFAALIGAIGFGGTLLYLPEVKIGINITQSDILKDLAYHEFAHASHYTRTGPGPWDALVLAETISGGHGTQSSVNAEMIALFESWPEFLGNNYTHRTYGNFNSILNDWQIRSEQRWNETPNHIPIGLYNDLIDNGEQLFDRDPNDSVVELVSACDAKPFRVNCTIIQDIVSGFTIAQMFSCLTPTTITVNDFQNILITNHLQSTTNSQQQVDDLFNSY
jgi:hypothetical protein